MDRAEKESDSSTNMTSAKAKKTCENQDGGHYYQEDVFRDRMLVQPGNTEKEPPLHDPSCRKPILVTHVGGASHKPQSLKCHQCIHTGERPYPSAVVPNHEELQKDDTRGTKHCHDNSHAREARETEKKVAQRRLYVVSVVCLLFMVGEIVGGYLAGSLAVMTDAAHLLTDLTSFIISLFSLWLSSKPATQKLSYGWHRAEILGALLSVFTIWLVTGVLVYLAVERLISDDYTIEGNIMLITSGCAVVANIIMAVTLHQSGHGHSHGGLSSHGHSHSHKKGKEKNQMPNEECIDMEQNQTGHGRRTQQANASVRAAFVHVMGDLLQSVSVLVSAVIIFFKPEYKMADPICTFLFSILVLCTTFTIMRDILLILMEGTPSGVKYSEVLDHLSAVKGVTAVHNLHIWALTMNQAVLSAHVAIDDSVDAQTALREMTQACFSSYNFHSVTIQMERQADLKPGCSLCENPKK